MRSRGSRHSPVCGNFGSACSLPRVSRASGARSSSHRGASRPRGRSPRGLPAGSRSMPGSRRLRARSSPSRPRMRPTCSSSRASCGDPDRSSGSSRSTRARSSPPDVRLAYPGPPAAPRRQNVPVHETTAFADRLADAVARKRSQLVVGLDPLLDVLPMELRGEAVLGRPSAAAAVVRFCNGIVDAVGPYVVAVKPQAAFFEALGSDGMRALEEVCEYARSSGLLVLLDVKRGDIGSTSRAYAAAYLEPRDGSPPLADAVTASPYLGLDSVEPFLAACRRYGAGVFFLVRTSNAGATDVQDLAMSDGSPVCHHVAHLVREWAEPPVGESGMSSVGAVVGATHPRAVSEARRLLPHSPMLLPGVGAQGATPADVARAFTAGPASALVTASRSVIYAYRESEADWRSAAGAEAQQLAAQVWAAAGW